MNENRLPSYDMSLDDFKLALAAIAPKTELPDTNAADMARCVSRLRAHLKPKHLLTWWILAQCIGAGIYLAQLASMHFGGAQ